MEVISMTLDFARTHGGALLDIAFAVISAASLIAALTPTPRDDLLFGKLYKLVDALALNVGHAKETPPNRGAQVASGA